MSASSPASHAAPKGPTPAPGQDLSHAAHDVAAHGHHEAPHGSFKGYVTGFLLSVVLTAIPFWLVMGKVIANPTATALAITALAAVQIVVHMVFFLHMDGRQEGGWTMMALVFTVVIVVIVLSGSLWVMYHLNTNMMPMSPHDMRNMP